MGMERAFKLAGAKKLLVSLWSIPAKQTEELLTKFYANWLQGLSMSKHCSMHRATCKNIPLYYWAGFVLKE